MTCDNLIFPATDIMIHRSKIHPMDYTYIMVCSLDWDAPDIFLPEFVGIRGLTPIMRDPLRLVLIAHVNSQTLP